MYFVCVIIHLKFCFCILLKYMLLVSSTQFSITITALYLSTFPKLLTVSENFQYFFHGFLFHRKRNCIPRSISHYLSILHQIKRKALNDNHYEVFFNYSTSLLLLKYNIISLTWLTVFSYIGALWSLVFTL